MRIQVSKEDWPRVVSATFHETGADAERHRIGTVSVKLETGHQRSFRNIDKNIAVRWIESKCSESTPAPPFKMRSSYHGWLDDITLEIYAQREQQAEVEADTRRTARKARFKAANVALEKKIGTEQYRQQYGKPPSEEEPEPDPKKYVSPYSPDNPRWKKLNEAVRAQIGEAEYQKRFGKSK